MKVGELMEKLREFNPMAEVRVRADDRRIALKGICTWTSHDGESPGNYDMAKSKMFTPRVTLDTDDNDSEIICTD